MAPSSSLEMKTGGLTPNGRRNNSLRPRRTLVPTNITKRTHSVNSLSSSEGAYNSPSKKKMQPEWKKKSIAAIKRAVAMPKTWQETFEEILRDLIDLDEFSYYSKAIELVLCTEKLIDSYFEKVKNPRDLQAIGRRLRLSRYEDPWEFIKDVYLVFDNARYFNRPKTIGYDKATPLLLYFEETIPDIMMSYGYCCGRYERRVLYCQGKLFHRCVIDLNEWYHFYNGVDICDSCFDIPGSTVSYRDLKKKKTFTLDKNGFERTENLRPVYEPMVHCIRCSKRFHQFCVLHHDEIWPEGFTCDRCQQETGMSRRPNEFTAKNFKETTLSKSLESRLNKLLKANNVESKGSAEVFIRVLSSMKMLSEIQESMKQQLKANDPLHNGIPYRARTIFAFQNICGRDVCFFGMHTQEYGVENTPLPNQRSVYLAYIDSVQYFVPRELKTKVYQDIVLGYLDFVKLLGYTSAYIWACPPATPRSDYIFRFHPPDQKMPDSIRLRAWYRKLLDLGLEQQIVLEYHDIYKEACKSHIKTVMDLPFFDGDLIPLTVENEIDEILENKKKEQEKAGSLTLPGQSPEINSQNNPYSVHSPSGQSPATSEHVSGISNSSTETVQLVHESELLSKVQTELKKYQNSFFVARLQEVEDANSVIREVDGDVDCSLVQSRDEFLLFSKHNNYEFSTLPRAQFATMSLLHEVSQRNPIFLKRSCYDCENIRSSNNNRSPICEMEEEVSVVQQSIADGDPVVEEESSLVEAESSVVQEESSVTEKDASVFGNMSSVVENMSSVVEDMSSVAKEESSVVEAESSVVQEESSVAEEEASVVKAESYVAENMPFEEMDAVEEYPVAEDVSAVVEDVPSEEMNTVEEHPVTEEESSLVEDVSSEVPIVEEISAVSVTPSSSSSPTAVVHNQVYEQQSSEALWGENKTRFLRCLQHASYCSRGCQRNCCQSMKLVFEHHEICVVERGYCLICTELLKLCSQHALKCKEPICKVPFCTNMKRRMAKEARKKREVTEHIKWLQITKRRRCVPNNRRTPDPHFVFL